jgi:hypothetical protein
MSAPGVAHLRTAWATASRRRQEAGMARPQHGTQARGRTDPPAPRSALWLPIFDARADPVVVARLAAEGEEAGWHGVFVWDHLRWRAPVRQVADPWITLAAIAAAHQLRLGPWSRPWPPPAGQGGQGDRDPGPAQRRPAHPRRRPRQRPLRQRAVQDRRAARRPLRGQMLDEALEIRTAAWSGAPVQRPGVPVWAAGFPGTRCRWTVRAACFATARGEPEP